MADSRFVLDTSAIFTLIEDEDGSDRVEQVLRENEVIVAWVVLMEMMYISRQEKGEETALKRYAAIKQMGVTIMWDANEPLLLIAAHLKADHRISFADAIVAATAIHQKAILLHKDPEYEALYGQLAMESLPYKTNLR
ncbi:MAG: PIN domain-containing protein [Chloroflexota bacterium]